MKPAQHNTQINWLLLVVLFLAIPAWAALPGTINYQAYLTDDKGIPIDDALNITFRLYTSASGGSSTGWEETQTVLINKGLFQVELGALTPLAFSDFDVPLYLGITIQGETEMSPRKEITLTSYAIKANDAETLMGSSVADLDESADLSAHAAQPAAHHSKTENFSELSGQVSDAQIPDTVTLDSELESHTANSSAHHSKTENFSELVGQVTDAQVPNNITINQASNADTVDGLHAGSFMSATTDNWVNTTGDSMDGNLTVMAKVGIGDATPDYLLDVYGQTSGYLGYFYNDNNGSGSTYGLYARGDAYDTGSYVGRGGYFIGRGGSSSGNAYGTYHLAYAYGTGTAYGVYSDADGGSTSGREYAFYGLGDGYFSGSVSIGTDLPYYKFYVQGDKVDTYLVAIDHTVTAEGSAYGFVVNGNASATTNGSAQGGEFYAWGGSNGGYASGLSSYTRANGTATAWGVLSEADGGNTTGPEWAFYGSGDGYFSGTLSKGAGGFKIDHPLDPANKTLSHSFVESPDMMNIYNGSVVLDNNGDAIVTLPDWFEALNKDFQYQLTAIGAPASTLHVAREIKNNQFQIAGGNPGMKVSWQVTGIRQDAYANAKRIVVEENKNSEEVGAYLHPEAFGLSNEQSVARVHIAARARVLKK